jgi:hypothetical protein
MKAGNSRRAEHRHSEERAQFRGDFLAGLLDYPGAENALKVLVDGGMKRDVILRLLGTVFIPAGRRGTEKQFGPKDLRRVAAQIENIRKDIANLNSSPIVGLEWSLAPYPELKAAYRGPFSALPNLLGDYSVHLKVLAWRLAEYGKTKPSTKKMFTMALLEYVAQVTGDEHYDEIACLITAAAATMGRTEVVEPSALRMQLKRHRKSITEPRFTQSMPKNLRREVENRLGKVANAPKRLTLGERLVRALERRVELKVSDQQLDVPSKGPFSDTSG